MPASRNEIEQILAAIAAADRPEDLALVSVVDLEGSGYRRTGARMLVHREGNWIGAISGGCLEGNALRRARQVMDSRTPQLVTYDTRSDESAREVGASLGCNGVLRVWIEPVDARVRDGLERLSKAFLRSGESWLGRRLDGENGGGLLAWEELENRDLVREEGLQERLRDGQKVLFAVEKVIPATRLLIFGGGHDARPVTELARQMGWQTVLTDDCPAKAIPARFPHADRVVHLDRECAVTRLEPDAWTAALLISHNFGYDKAILRGLAGYELPYIGVLGPRSRFERLNDELGGIWTGHAALHAPVGLDIGGQTPFAIALSIVAEIQAVMTGRTGGSLKHRKGTIHPHNKVIA